MSDALVYLANSAAWSLGGFALGWLLARQRRDVADIKEALMTDDDTSQDRRPRRLDRIMGPFVVVVVCLGAVISGLAAQQSREAIDRTERLSDCTQSVLQRTVRALNERTELTGAQTDSRHNVFVTQRDLVTAMLDEDSAAAELRALARKYRQAVNRQITVEQRAHDRRATNPYPTVDEIRDCN